MYIKRYEAPSLIQAVELVRKELGSDAVILSTRSLRSRGFIPWFRKPVFEVIAARDADEVEAKVSTPIVSVNPPAKPGSLDVVVGSRRDESLILGGTELSTPTNEVAEMTPSVREEDTQSQDVKALIVPVLEEIASLKAQISQLSISVAQQVVPLTAEPFHQETLESGVAESRQGSMLYVERVLKDRGLSPQLADSIVNRLLQTSSTEELNDTVTAYSKLQSVLCEMLNQDRNWGDCINDGPKVIALVGPTGVGKTTTIAKLAARYSLMQNKNVALIAADTYRIAAVSQLRMYGELLGVEVDVVHGADEIAVVVENRMNKDVVLIDTAGRSPMSPNGLDSLKVLLEAAKPTEIHLVMSATTKGSDMADVMNKFGSLSYNRLLFAKVDESHWHGDMIEAILKSRIDVSFLCTGQGVPNDIEEADPRRMVSLLLPDLAKA